MQDGELVIREPLSEKIMEELYDCFSSTPEWQCAEFLEEEIEIFHEKCDDAANSLITNAIKAFIEFADEQAETSSGEQLSDILSSELQFIQSKLEREVCNTEGTDEFTERFQLAVDEIIGIAKHLFMTYRVDGVLRIAIDEDGVTVLD